MLNGAGRTGSLCWVHIGIGGAGLHVIYGDCAWSQVASQGLGERDDGALDQRVDGSALKRHTSAVATADENDASAIAHVPHGFLSRDEHSLNVDGDHPLEIFERELIDGRNSEKTRVVDEDVEGTAKRLGRPGDRGASRIRIGSIALNGERFAAGRFDGSNNLLCLGRSRAVSKSNGSAIRR